MHFGLAEDARHDAEEPVVESRDFGQDNARADVVRRNFVGRRPGERSAGVAHFPGEATRRDAHRKRDRSLESLRNCLFVIVVVVVVLVLFSRKQTENRGRGRLRKRARMAKLTIKPTLAWLEPSDNFVSFLLKTFA
jgi:hypothetical protein